MSNQHEEQRGEILLPQWLFTCSCQIYEIPKDYVIIILQRLETSTWASPSWMFLIVNHSWVMTHEWCIISYMYAHCTMYLLYMHRYHKYKSIASKKIKYKNQRSLFSFFRNLPLPSLPTRMYNASFSHPDNHPLLSSSPAISFLPRHLSLFSLIYAIPVSFFSFSLCCLNHSLPSFPTYSHFSLVPF